MNIKHENTEEKVQILTVEIVKTDYSVNVENSLKKYRRTAQIPGFRVGNVPMGLIKRNYEKPLVADEVNKIVTESLNDFFKNNNINILFEPILVEEKSSVDFESSEDFIFVFEFAVQPEFVIDFSSLPLLKAFRIVASKDEIEDFKNQMRKRYGDYVNSETIENEDYISVKWEEKETGFFFIKDLTEQSKTLFFGKKMDEEVEVSFKELFNSEENLKKLLKKTDDNFGNNYADKVILTISSIGRLTLAEMNEEFFQKAFPDGSVTTVEDYERVAAQQIEEQWKRESDRKFMNDAITLFVQNVSINLPEDFIKHYILKKNTEMTEETLTREWEQYYTSFKWQLIESKIAKDEKLEVTVEEIKNYIRVFYYQNYFMQFQPDEVEERLTQLVEQAIKDQKQVKQLYEQIFDQKILWILKQKMRLEERSGTFEQFIAFMSEKEVESNPKEVKLKKTRRTPAKKKGTTESE